ncbi:hypothetical protein VCHC50A2_3046B, partial [Vibrio cholerae HC-50A2]
LEVATILAKFVRSNHRVCLCSWGMMRAILGSQQRPADGCANFFQTNLSLTCCLPATPSSLGIPILALWILGLFCRSAIYGASICAIIMAFFVICFTVLSTTKDGEYFAIQRFRLR